MVLPVTDRTQLVFIPWVKNDLTVPRKFNSGTLMGKKFLVRNPGGAMKFKPIVFYSRGLLIGII